MSVRIFFIIKGREYPSCYGTDYVYYPAPSLLKLKVKTNKIIVCVNKFRLKANSNYRIMQFHFFFMAFKFFLAPHFFLDVLQGKCKIHVKMTGNVFHVMALGEQITNIAKICIIGNFRYAVPAEPYFV